MKRLLISALVLTSSLVPACADPTVPAASDPTATGGIDHATGGSDLIFRFGYEGGFTPVEYQLTNIPAFSLYGDGTIITPGPQIEIYPGPALPSIESRAITEDGIQMILQAAIDAGLTSVEDMTDMGSVTIADAPEAVFTLRAGGSDRTVRVYALSEMGDEKPFAMTKDEFDARRRLQGFVADLFAMDGLVPASAVREDPVPFEASGSRVYVGTYRGDGELPQPGAAWPLDTPLATFGTGGNSYGYACGTVRGEDWTNLLLPTATTANQLTPWLSGGERYGLQFRPLLPDETGC
jgi:hypothetical protein